MHIRTGNVAYSIGPYPVQSLWNTGWRVGLWRRIGPLCILVYTRQTPMKRSKPKLPLCTIRELERLLRCRYPHVDRREIGGAVFWAILAGVAV